MLRSVYVVIRLMLFLNSLILFANEEFLSEPLLDLGKQEQIEDLWARTTNKNYPIKSHIPEEYWERLKPHFLPFNHAIKDRLDEIFHKNRVILNEKTLKKAGFNIHVHQDMRHIIFARHPEFKGYVFKIYIDTQPFVNEWLHWIKRLEGAQAIRQYLKENRLTHFKVPRKWIYPLPSELAPPLNDQFYPKEFILIAQDMQILDSKANLQAFKKKITPQILDDLFLILTDLGLLDSVYPDNIPFTKSGHQAFIDTEHCHSLQPIPYERLTRHFSEDMQEYWHSLINLKY